jgi:hypothetical protein
MRCQIPGCKNKGVRASTKDGIFLGVHLEHVLVYTCGRHTEKEVNEALERVGEEEATALQPEASPFLELQKIRSQSA